MVAAGASGYVLKDVDPASLARSIQDAHAGHFQLDDALTRRVIMRLGSSLRRSRRSLAEPLTERETQILRMVMEGTSNKAIASRLGLGEGTIKSHLRNIYRKLQVRTRAEAAAQAVQLDI
jgi:DNA-binding NarL/FixJ family response regulator